LVAAFNIMATRIMIIMEKRREIGILMSMGITKSGIMRIFLLNGVIIGLIGTVIGTITSVALCAIQQKYQLIPLPGDVYFINFLPVRLQIRDILLVFIELNYKLRKIKIESIMKTLHHLFITLLVAVGFAATVSAQNIILQQSNESGIYKKGEKIKVAVLLNKLEVDSLTVEIEINYSNQKSIRKVKYSGRELEIFNQSFNKPTSVIFKVKADSLALSIGLVVAPEEFDASTPRPKDFKKFWKEEKKELNALEMEVKSTPVVDFENGYSCADVEINCTGPKPVRGYFVKPDSAKEKSLPIVLVVHAAGVKGSWCLAKPKNALQYARMGKGALCFDLNAHGMLNGQPQEYYDNLEAGELKNYMHFGLENREENYFRGMYLRLLRTLDFLKKQPEWDGKRIIVIGESQGGGQALAAAGLDKDVTAVVATVPAMCDWGRTLKGEKGGWPNPFSTKYSRDKMLHTVPYFDAVHLLKGSKATLVTEIGFIDKTCPSSSVYAAINQSKGKKIIFGVPYREHNLRQESFRKTWQENVYQPKMAFIEDFLK